MDQTTFAPLGHLATLIEHDKVGNYTAPPNKPAFRFLSAEASLILRILFMIVLSVISSIVGIVANIINIIVFIKQGAYKECGSVNLLGLAISDLCVVTTMFYTSFSYILFFFQPPHSPWVNLDFIYITAAVPHLMASQITRAFTAYVSFERCVCVVLPFKVKRILSPKRSMAIMAVVSLSVATTFVPIFVISRLEKRYHPILNITYLARVRLPNLDVAFITDIVWYINSVTFNLLSVAIVLVCTLITVSRVKLSKTWRQSVATGGVSDKTPETEPSTQTKPPTDTTTTKVEPHNGAQPQNVNVPAKQSAKLQKEKRLIKMIMSISVIFLICYLPDLIYLQMHMVDDEISTLGRYHNLAKAMYSMTFFMETFNSSINIFVYYKMSSRYRQIFRQMMGLAKES